MKKICCFAGHGKIQYSDEIYDKLTKLIEQLILTEGVSEFWVGNYGSFDGLCAKAVRILKNTYPHIELTLVIPYLTSYINENKAQYSKNYTQILVADIPLNTPKKLHIIKCNEYMVEKSDYLICYVKNTWGGACKTLEYARGKCVKIFNIA